MAIAALLLGVGFGLTAFATTLLFYAFTVAVWTLGEVIGAAIAPTIVSEMSPPGTARPLPGHLGLVVGLAFFIGPALGGYVYHAVRAPTSSGHPCSSSVVLLFVGYLLLRSRRARAADLAAETADRRSEATA